MSVAPTLVETTDKIGRRPRWWLEMLVIVWLCWVYDAISNLAPLRRVAPYDHARTLLHLEQLLHLDPEHALNHWLSAHPAFGWWVSNYYDNAHFVVTLGVLGWLWLRHPGPYRPLRTSLVLINVIGFFVYWRYPMAPPRLTIPAQYPDVVAATHAFGGWHSGTLAHHANELAAMPSLHLAWAAWSAYAFWLVFRRHWWAWLAWVHPVITAFAVMATGNHFLGDCVAGVLVMVLPVAGARSVVRLLEGRLVHVTPKPVLVWLERLDERVPRPVVMRRRVTARRAVAAPDVPAAGTAPQVNPVAAGLEAFDAAVAARLVSLDGLEVGAGRRHASDCTPS